MEQRLEYSNSHLTCCSHFPWPLFIAHTKHSGVLILTKKSCFFALSSGKRSWAGPSWADLSHQAMLCPQTQASMQSRFWNKMRNQGTELLWGLRMLLFVRTDATSVVCLGDVGKAQIRSNHLHPPLPFLPSPYFEVKTRLAERQQVANMEVLNCSLKNDRE